MVNFVFPYIHSLHTKLGYVKLDISGDKIISFQGCKIHLSNSFLMTQQKRSWQYWHSYIAEFVKNSCEKPLLLNKKTNAVNNKGYADLLLEIFREKPGFVCNGRHIFEATEMNIWQRSTCVLCE